MFSDPPLDASLRIRIFSDFVWESPPVENKHSFNRKFRSLSPTSDMYLRAGMRICNDLKRIGIQLFWNNAGSGSALKQMRIRNTGRYCIQLQYIFYTIFVPVQYTRHTRKMNDNQNVGIVSRCRQLKAGIYIFQSSLGSWNVENRSRSRFKNNIDKFLVTVLYLPFEIVLLK